MNTRKLIHTLKNIRTLTENATDCLHSTDSSVESAVGQIDADEPDLELIRSELHSIKETSGEAWSNVDSVHVLIEALITNLENGGGS